MTDEIRPMKPEGFIPYPQKPMDSTPDPTIPMAKENIPVIDDHVSIFNIILLWIKEGCISSIISQKGGTMNSDNKATVTGIVTGILALAGVFGFAWPVEIITSIVSIGIMLLGYFTNKKDATPAP